LKLAGTACSTTANRDIRRRLSLQYPQITGTKVGFLSHCEPGGAQTYNGLLLSIQRRDVGAVLFKPVEILEEQQPGGLLGVIELGGAARFFAQCVVDVAEGLFKHGVAAVNLKAA
jgi:hypothetical protein